MAPHQGNQKNENYGSLSIPETVEEGKCQSDADPQPQPQQPYDMEQMRLIVSSLRQQQNQQGETQVPSFTPDDYYKVESRQIHKRTILSLILGLLVGWLLTRGWSAWQASLAPTTTLTSRLALEGAFDYIVVGGGPAGIVAATKLSQKLPTANVVLIESGSVSQSSVVQAVRTRNGDFNSSINSIIDPSGRIQPQLRPEPEINKYDIPLMWSGIANTQRRMENFQQKPSPKYSTYWPIPLALLTRGLGGCGLHNAMVYIRSLPSCFEKWDMAQWTFEKMLPVYKSLEQYDTNYLNSNPTSEWLQSRGSEGPIRTTPAGPATDSMGDYFVQAALASGMPRAGGTNNSSFNQIDPDDRIGAGYYEFNTHNGLRQSVASALLGDESKIPSNLLVLTSNTVTQVLWSKDDPKKPKAMGVTYLDHSTGKQGKVLLDHKGPSEVILATGAIMTPQILWNSGIGDGGEMVHLPGVGKNVQDHPVLGMAFQVTNKAKQDSPQMYAVSDEMEDYKLATRVLNEMDREAKQASKKKGSTAKNETSTLSRQKVESRLGILGTPGFSAGAFLRSPWKKEGAPDIQLTVFPRVVEPHQPKSPNQIDVNFMRSQSMLVTVALLEPEARYEVKPANMNSLDASTGHAAVSTPYDVEQAGFEFSKALQYPLPSLQLPKGRQEYLTDDDVKRLAWGMEQVRSILRYPPMDNITTTELYPGKSVTDGPTLDQYIRVNHLANSHWVGSTKMGRDDDPMAVLDESLRVRRVKGLRVFDSGAIPIVPNGNTHSTVCAVASRGVDLIVEERSSTSG